MAFAIFYNHSDLTPISANVESARSDSRLPPGLRTAATRAWNNGMSGWSSAAQAPANRQEGDPDTRIIVINNNNLSLANFRNLLYTIASNVPGATYMARIADDMGGSSGAVEPWPQ